MATFASTKGMPVSPPYNSGPGGQVFVELIRLSLFQREQQDAFEHRPADGGKHTRESWLRYAFSEQIKFSHRGGDFTFVPDRELTTRDDLIVGRIGRERQVKENAPPEEGLKERVHSEWQASVVIIDPTHHDDGQKVAMQCREEEIGQSVAVFQSLVTAMNYGTGPFFIEAIGLADPASFWGFVREHKGDIVSVTIEAAAPNMFGSKTDFEKELKDLRDHERAQKIKIQLKNESSLDPDTKRMHEIVDYAVAGGGTIKAATSKKKTYNSRKKTRRVQIAEPLDPENLAKHLAAAIRDTLKQGLKK